MAYHDVWVGITLRIRTPSLNQAQSNFYPTRGISTITISNGPLGLIFLFNYCRFLNFEQVSFLSEAR